MPWHLQEPSEPLYAQPACGAGYLTRSTTALLTEQDMLQAKRENPYRNGADHGE